MTTPMLTRPVAPTSHPRSATALRLLLGWGLAILLGAGWVVTDESVAVAHDELIGSTPEDGDVLPEAPEQVVLTFSGDISDIGAQIEVTDAGGDRVAGAVAVADTQVSHSLPPDVGDGEYAVGWRVTSSDGHPIAGELSFIVEVEPEPVTEEASTTTAPPVASEEESTAAPVPQNDAAAPDVAADGTGSGDGRIPGWVFPVIGVALVALLGVGVTALRRR